MYLAMRLRSSKRLMRLPMVTRSLLLPARNINFRGKAITVEGASTAGESIIDGSANGRPVVSFKSGETRNPVLSNLTIQNGSPSLVPDAGGIYMNGSSPTIQNNIIQNNFDCGIGISENSVLRSRSAGPS
jgi:hypothetical protein